MYESEVNQLTEPLDAIPREIQARFGELRGQIVARTLLPWGEHCTECNWPTCYTTCQLYTPRTDGACRLFVRGMVRIDHPLGSSPYLLKLEFKPWAKLWTIGNLRLNSVAAAQRRERNNIALGAVARNLPMPAAAKARVLRKVAHWRRVEAETAPPPSVPPDAFLIECYNPNDRALSLTLTMGPREPGAEKKFHELITLAPGFNRHSIPLSSIQQDVALQTPFEVELVPNGFDGTTLVFGFLDFVKLEEPARRPVPAPAKWKCIVWDLDHTLWDGILIEDGAQGVRVRDSVVRVIQETDRRGILHSVASKNHAEDAGSVLRAAGLDEFFLHPQISWGPKSEGVARIARELNIGLDSILFVDDQPFERAEVLAALPQVQVLDAAHAGRILTAPETAVPVTEESRQRRHLYRKAEQREAARESYQGDYRNFLKDCKIRLQVDSLNGGNLERVYELAQRTNQMNFSGNRYPMEALQGLIGHPDFLTCVLSCDDRFGSYGIIGFALVDVREPRLMDLMFSCRVQSKRVEHAFLRFLLLRFVRAEGRDFFANYRATPKNAASGRVFSEMGFQPVAETEGVTSLKFSRAHILPEEDIVTITDSKPTTT